MRFPKAFDNKEQYMYIWMKKWKKKLHGKV